MNKEKFAAKLKANPRPVVVDFWAAWCMPCRMMEPALEKVEQAYKGRVDVWKINADEQPGLLKELGIMGIPTTIAYRDGQEMIRKVGAQSEGSLSTMFASVESGEPIAASRNPLTRVVLGGGGLLAALFGALMPQPSILLIALGAVLLFSAVYDRCPVYNALKPKIKALFKLG